MNITQTKILFSYTESVTLRNAASRVTCVFTMAWSTWTSGM